MFFIDLGILKDVNNDSERSVKNTNDKYTIISKVNYPNNNDLKTQEVTLGWGQKDFASTSKQYVAS